jgi:hypothetical protein
LSLLPSVPLTCPTSTRLKNLKKQKSNHGVGFGMTILGMSGVCFRPLGATSLQPAASQW